MRLTQIHIQRNFVPLSLRALARSWKEALRDQQTELLARVSTRGRSYQPATKSQQFMYSRNGKYFFHMDMHFLPFGYIIRIYSECFLPSISFKQWQRMHHDNTCAGKPQMQGMRNYLYKSTHNMYYNSLQKRQVCRRSCSYSPCMWYNTIISHRLSLSVMSEIGLSCVSGTRVSLIQQRKRATFTRKNVT